MPISVYHFPRITIRTGHNTPGTPVYMTHSALSVAGCYKCPVDTMPRGQHLSPINIRAKQNILAHYNKGEGLRPPPPSYPH